MDVYSLSLAVSITTILAGLLAYHWKRIQFYALGSKLPGPPTVPLFGNLLSFRTQDLSQFFENIHQLVRTYGTAVRLWLGPVLAVIISGPEELAKVVEHDKIGDRGKYGKMILGPMFGNGLLAIDVKMWRSHRKIISAAFHINILEKFVENFAKNSLILVNRFKDLADGSSYHDIVPFLNHCTLDIISETCFAYEMNAQVNNDQQVLAHNKVIMDGTTVRITDPLLMFEWIFNLTKFGKRYNAAVKYYHDLIRSAIEEKLRNKKYVEDLKKRPTLMDLLLQNGEMTTKEILGEVSSIGGAGSETTATACCFVMALLGEHQGVQEKVLEEQRCIFGEDFLRPVTSEDLPSMVYLEQVLNESMRLFPPLAFFGREATKNIDLGNGNKIPVGSHVLVAAYETHRNPQYFPDPEKFDPERFSSENVAGRHPYAFVPFGFGRRMCVGRVFSIMEAKTILSTVLRNFHILGVRGGIQTLKKELHVAIVLTAVHGVRLKMSPRKP